MLTWPGIPLKKHLAGINHFDGLLGLDTGMLLEEFLDRFAFNPI